MNAARPAPPTKDLETAQMSTTSPACANVRSLRRLALLFTCPLLLWLGVASASAAPLLTVDIHHHPTTIQPGGLGQYWFDVSNLSGEPTSAPLTLKISLPPGLTRESVEFYADMTNYEHNVKWSCPGSVGDSILVCTTTNPLKRHVVNRLIEFTVKAAATPKFAIRTTTAELIGGGAREAPASEGCAPGAAACTTESTETSLAPTVFGILPESFVPDFFEEDGVTAVRESGSHPDLLTVPFDLTSEPLGTESLTQAGTVLTETPVEHIRDLQVDLPQGFIGAPTAVGECGQAAFTLNLCPPSSQVGRIDLNIALAAGNKLGFSTGVFNLSHPRGVVTDLGFALAGNPVHIKAFLDPASNYGITTKVSDINESAPVFNQRLTIWGVPAEHSHDSERCFRFNYFTFGENALTDEECATDAARKPFLTLPSQCGVDHQLRFRNYDSWQHPGLYGPDVAYTLPGQTTDCERPRFEPDIEVEPTGHQANTPTGLDVHLRVAQNEDPDALSTPPVKRVNVTLPQGMSFSPSFADGLRSCSSQQIGLGTNDPVQCPDASRIGEVTLSTPLLPKAAEGSMFLAAQGDNPFGSLFAVYLVLHDTEERGILIKIPGRIDVDPQTGQISTLFDDTPQFPFSELTLKFRSGSRAPLVSPPSCGAHSIGVEISSYARPQEVLDLTNSYTVNEGPGGTPCPPDSAHRPFAPHFSGGTLNPLAGAYSPFLFRLSREDSEQELSQVTTVLPPGLLAKIAGIPFCPDAALASISTELGAGASEQASPACPPASQIGTVSAGLGAGPGPNYFPGRVYLAGPYKGAPLSLAIVAPGLAGPFDLGNVAVRVALRVDAETSRVTAVSDPFPTILHGVILRVRDVRLRLDRPETTLNPTNCSPTSLDAAITGVGGDLLSTADDSLFNASDRFQVGDCGRLGFQPQIFFKLKGGTHRGDHPAFFSRVLARVGDANFGKAIVALPKSEFLENAHIGTVCTRVQFRADQCPAASIYGHAKAVTPLLDDPVEGDLILRSSDHPLPDLVARLRGQISANLVGRIDSVNGGIRSSFETVPDVPITEFTLTMLGGDKGLLVNSRNLCKAPARADVKFTSQSNRFLRLRPLMQTSCKGRAKSKVKSKRAPQGAP